MKKDSLLICIIFFLLLRSITSPAQDEIDADSLGGFISFVQKLKFNHPDSAIALFKIGIDRAKVLGDLRLERLGNTGTGITYGIRGDYAEAMEYFDRGLAVSLKAGEPAWIAGDHSNKGIIYKYLGDFDKSMDEYYKTMTIYDSIGDLSGKAATCQNLGVLHEATGEYSTALEYFLLADELLVKLGERDKSQLMNLGILKYRMGEYEGALELLFEYLDQAQEKNNRIDLAAVYQNIGTVYTDMGRLDEAEYYSRISLELATELESSRSKTESAMTLAKIYKKRGRLKEALQWRKDQLKYALETRSNEEISIAEVNLANAYNDIGQHAKAFEHLKKYIELRDTLFQEEKNNAYKQWQTRLDVFGKDQEIKSQDLKLELLNSQMRSAARLRLALAISLALALLSGFLFYQRARLRKRANELLTRKNLEIEAQKQEIEVMNRELEKRMLRAQINPHFIFNSLNSIQHFITSDEKLKALKYLSKFSKLLRQSLENSVSVNVPLVEEILLLETYLELESLRFNNSFKYAIDCDDNVDVYETEVPILLVQPFVENAVLHAFSKNDLTKPKELNINFSEDQGYILCKVSDNGIGRKAAGEIKDASISKRPSRGISVTEQRLAILYPDDRPTDVVKINDLTDSEGKPCGTEVIVKIPKD